MSDEKQVLNLDFFEIKDNIIDSDDSAKKSKNFTKKTSEIIANKEKSKSEKKNSDLSEALKKNLIRRKNVKKSIQIKGLFSYKNLYAKIYARILIVYNYYSFLIYTRKYTPNQLQSKKETIRDRFLKFLKNQG